MFIPVSSSPNRTAPRRLHISRAIRSKSDCSDAPRPNSTSGLQRTPICRNTCTPFGQRPQVCGIPVLADVPEKRKGRPRRGRPFRAIASLSGLAGQSRALSRDVPVKPWHDRAHGKLRRLSPGSGRSPCRLRQAPPPRRPTWRATRRKQPLHSGLQQPSNPAVPALWSSRGP